MVCLLGSRWTALPSCVKTRSCKACLLPHGKHRSHDVQSVRIWQEDERNAACLQGPAVVAEKLSYFVQTGQMVSYMQQAGYRLGTVQLTKFSPLLGVPGAHAPGFAPLPPGGRVPQGTVSTAQAGKQQQAPASTAFVLPAPE